MPQVYSPSPSQGPLRQGEILSSLTELRSVAAVQDGTAEIAADIVDHPFALILTQDCDLDFDFKARVEDEASRRVHKLLPNVLFCELWLAENLRGNHGLNHALWRRVTQNQDERYHFLPCARPEEDALGQGFTDDLAIDFKRVFTIATEALYSRLGQAEKRRCCLQPPFLQDLSNRFGYYQMRVALPETKLERTVT